jgi:O-succinylhomoserine sulfhydrylase
VEPYLKHTGAAMSPFTAWIMLKGMETLDLRVRAQAAGAQSHRGGARRRRAARAGDLPGAPGHPQHGIAMAQMGSGGTVVSLDIAGGKEAAFRFLNALKIVTISNNLGDAKSIVTHPATTTHQRLSEETRAALGITPGLVRLSVGIEDPADFWPTSGALSRRSEAAALHLPSDPAPGARVFLGKSTSVASGASSSGSGRDKS